MGEEQNLVKLLLGLGLAVGVYPGGLDVPGMSPNLNNLAADHRRLLPVGDKQNDDEGEERNRAQSGPDNVAGSLGKLFAEGRIVKFFVGFLME
jgi:hypothetical protein